MLQDIVEDNRNPLGVMLPSMESVLSYALLDGKPDEEELTANLDEIDVGLDLEALLEMHEGKKAEISRNLEEEESSQIFNNFLEDVVKNNKKVGIVYYDAKTDKTGYLDEDKGKMYIVEDDKEDNFAYMFIPRGVVVNRVTQDVLGPNVLGRTWLGTGYIEVLDSLYGDAFQEVLLHELNHLLYPHENEGEIRSRTRRQLVSPIYH